MNEQSLLAVIVPRGHPNLLHTFVARVGNLLSMIGVPNERIDIEIEHFHDARAGKTTSKHLLGVMTDLATRCAEAIDQASPSSPVSLSDLELRLAKMRRPNLGFRRASDVALQLLQSEAKLGPF